MANYVAVTIDDETYMRLKEIAKRKGITISDAVKHALKAYILLTIPNGDLRLVKMPHYD